MADVQHRENVEPHDTPVGELVLEYLRVQQATLDQIVAALNRIESHMDSAARNGGRGLETPPQPTPPPAPAREPAPARAVPARPKARRLGRRRHARSCSVCTRESAAERTPELVSAGWMIAGQVAVCPQCREAGWRTSEDGGLPFRPRAPSGR